MCRGCESCVNPCSCCFECSLGGTYEPNCYNCSINSIFLCFPRCIGCIGCPTCLETREQAMLRKSRKQNNQQIASMYPNQAPIGNQMMNPHMSSPQMMSNPQSTQQTTTTTYYIQPNTIPYPMIIPANNMVYAHPY
jgi:hypothetical protein